MNFFKSNTAIVATVTLALMISATDTRAQTFSANIPEALNGTYELTFAFAASGAPYANGDKVTFVINGTNDSLCFNSKVLTSPYLRTADGQEEIFADSAANVFYAISDQANGAFNELNIYAPNDGANSWVGQFQGSRTSESVTCGSTSAPTGNTFTENGLSVSVDVKNIFDLAAQLYPGVFRTPGMLRQHDGYYYKYYRGTGSYIGFKDGKIFVLGGAFGSTIKEYGVVSTILADLQKVQAEKLATVSGDFKLTITGRYESSLITLNIPAIVIEKMPAPDPSDVDGMVKIMRDQGVQNIRNVKVTTINNSSSRVTFDLEFNADITGLGTVTYRLNYDYTR